MNHDNPASPVDPTPQPAAEFIYPAPQQDAAAVEPDAAEAIAFDDAAMPDDTPLPETALPTEVFTETPAPAAESAPPTGDVTLALSPSPGTPGEGWGEGSAQASIEQFDVAAVQADTHQLDVESSTLDVQGSDEDDEERPTLNVERPTSNEAPAPLPTLTVPSRRLISGGWTMGLLLSGIGIIAACVLIPQGDETRKLMYEREKLRADLQQVQKQVDTNDQFLQKIQTDPTLAQRLAQRQMKLIPAGTKVLDVEDASPTQDDKSPFLIVSVPPPAPMAPYQPRGGTFAQLCRNGRSQLYMIGGGLMLVAAGLVLGASNERA